MKIKLDPGAFMPEYAHEQDAGMDLRSPVDCTIESRIFGGCKVIDTGVHVEIPLVGARRNAAYGGLVYNTWGGEHKASVGGL